MVITPLMAAVNRISVEALGQYVLKDVCTFSHIIFLDASFAPRNSTGHLSEVPSIFKYMCNTVMFPAMSC